MNSKTKQLNRQRRHVRVRAKISGTASRPRISVTKTNSHIFVQAIDDVAKRTIVGTGDHKFKQNKSEAPKELKGKSAKAFTVGNHIGEELKKKGLQSAVFDKGGHKYHGRVKAVADGLRQAGIKV